MEIKGYWEQLIWVSPENWGGIQMKEDGDGCTEGCEEEGQGKGQGQLESVKEMDDNEGCNVTVLFSIVNYTVS